ncbi:MAG: 1-acyl-sn-glycerol-3-phosphate acyltransferase [Actinomycetota bacterium]|nr:1-acyl-sn-glycerol-3-phosphate acyltransferase [Actinomycetota bacterium]
MPPFLTSSEPTSKNVRTKPEIHGDLTFYWYCARFYTRMVHRLRKTGWAPLPETGPAILIANHTCCIDHLLLQSSARRVLGFMIAREMYELPVVRSFASRTGCIPVNRDGRDVQATRAALRALEEGRVVPIFPEGKITPESGRVLGPIRSGAAYIAVRSGAPVVPAFITGSPPTLDIGPSLWSLSRSRVRFGPPLDLSEFDPSQSRDKEILAEVTRRFERALRELQAESLRDEAASRPKRRFRLRGRHDG